MVPNRIALLHHKGHSIYRKIAFFVLRCRGLQVGKSSLIGKITCDWPNKLIIGHSCDIQDDVDFRIWHPYDDKCFIKLGDNVFIGHACEFVCNSSITIGNNCLIASKTTFNDTGHEFSRKENINRQPVTVKEIILKDDVWVGTSCVILQGVTIGKGAVIAAGSVVNKSIPEYEVWGGVPARFIKKRE
ncbi:DapH/DapD/GlmU-related protein [Flavobacterium sp. WC2429]|uniref:DapH/DapD/GlmU-related protein n=1 Tax=Flavobacterium sp. WC2429 TaxID=3234140 RepID=A0AB39WMQ8_9FLAO